MYLKQGFRSGMLDDIQDSKISMEENQIPTTYAAKEWEDKLYLAWEESGLFNPDECIKAGITSEDRPVFSLVLPPPNVTGTLHTGHAAMLAIEDTLVRYHRMRGDRTLWIPGTDHAAIATQSRVEKNLWKQEGKTRYDIGRDAFLKRVEQFAEESHDTIVRQTKKMGSSLDWSREAYTLDEKRGLAVRMAFKRMYDDGLIYRGYRVVNWSVAGQSTCSDDEVVTLERQATLYTFKYAKDFPISIATTRPETKLGDTAVAVHPEDERYKKYIGETFTVEVGAKKPLEIRIIGDESVDPLFGTGAVGVTPAHSHTDFEMRERHPDSNIALIAVIGQDGKMTENAGAAYAGLTTLEAREKFVAWLRENNLLEKEEDSIQNVGTSDRYEDVLEVIPMLQWFVAVNKEFERDGAMVTLKSLMQDAVREEEIKILPKRFEKTYFHWIDNLRDWCISRQIWFGHRIPVWYCLSCGKEVADPAVKAKWFIVRHGETEGNVKRVTQGHGDTPLTENGKKQVRAAAEQLRQHDIDLIISSDLGRCQQTAGIIAEVTGAPIEFDPAFRERDYGEAEGITYEKTQEKYPHSRVYDGVGSGIETYPAIEERVRVAFEKHRGIHHHKNIVIVSHGGAIRMLVKHIKKLDPTEAIVRPGIKNAEILSLDILEAPCPQCGNDLFEQDPDTLDTWFSSGLWTFSTLGWPDKEAKDFKTYHPTSLIETGYDILFFWVARMIMMSQYLLGTRPFDTVYLHGLVRDAEGRKMSKSLGNIIDPLDISEHYGADALRMALLSGSTPGNDTKLSDEKIIAMRNFVNKLWNLARYVGTQTDNSQQLTVNTQRNPESLTLSDADKYLINKLHIIVRDVTRHLDRYELSLATETLREFTWGTFADWYVETHKVEKNDPLLRYAFNIILKLWHPFMPFVTEAIHQTYHLDESKFLMISSWPAFDTTHKEITDENRFDLVKGLIVAIRNIRATYHIDPAKKMIVSAEGASERTLRDNEAVFKKLARVEAIQTKKTKEAPENSLLIHVGLLQVYLHLDGIVDIQKERTRFEKEISEKKKYIASLESKLGNKDFIKRAKPEIVAGEQMKLAEAKKELADLEHHLTSLL